MEKEEFTEDSLVEKVMEYFSEVTEEQARNDIHEFLELLDKNFMLDNGKPEPKIGTAKIKLTKEKADMLKKG